MRAWWRYLLVVLALLLLVLAGAAVWLVQGFDSEHVKRIASDWMRTHQDRELVFEGPVRLQLWPQPAVAVQRVRLSERGRPDKRFASIDSASLSLHLQPLLSRREIQVESVSAHGVTLRFTRDEAGARNVDDLLDRVAGGDTRSGQPLAIDRLELAELELIIDDAAAGVQGTLNVPQFSLGAFGPGLRSPLHMKARAALSEPPLTGALELEAGLSLLPPPRPGASPLLQLDKTGLRLRGQGFELEDLDASLQAESVRLEYGVELGLGDSRLELHEARLQFGGRRLGWQVASGQLELARLRLEMRERRVELEQLALQLKGSRGSTTLAAQLRWPRLDVRGDQLQGSAVDGSLTLGGDRRLQMQLSSQPPSGAFERITLPQLQLVLDGQFGSSALQGQAAATLLLEPQALAAGLDALSLRLQVDDPAWPALQLALQGQAQLTPDRGSGRLEGSINGQRVDARFEARLDRVRPFIDVQANAGTLDLNRFSTPAPRGAAPAPAAAAMPIDLQPLRAVDARLRLDVARLLRPPYRIDALALQARIDNGRLDLQRLTGRAWGGSFDASGSADAADNRLALRLRAEQVDMRAMLSDTTGYDGLRGRARIEADLQGRGSTAGALRATLDGTLRLSLQPAALRGVDLAQTLRGWRTATQDQLSSDATRQTDFSRLDGSFVLRNGVARNDDLDARSDFLRVSGAGTVDLAQGRLDYLLRTRVSNTGSGRAGPEMMMLNGVTVPVQLNGPFGQVQWQVNWAAVTAAVAARSVPNVARGTVGTVTRGATGVVRGAAELLRSIPGAATPAPR
ncbi:MAG TPA: AsmA family protein [Rubrivivax sp.]|nr:AsmA family protein [Rubrivivax sp.]